MTKSELFKKAHAMTKAVIQLGDDYRATFGASVRCLLSKTVDVATALTKLGGKLWEKGGIRRIYFNDLEDLMGLTVKRYNTGNISSARICGEKISNSSAYRMISSIDKLWFDLTDGKFYFKASDKDLAREICAKLRAKAAI